MNPDIHAAYVILSSGRASEALLWDRYPRPVQRWVGPRRRWVGARRREG